MLKALARLRVMVDDMINWQKLESLTISVVVIFEMKLLGFDLVELFVDFGQLRWRMGECI